MNVFEKNRLNKSSNRYFQIDILKSLMMALVIMDHSFTHAFLGNLYNSFWERISIPVLMVIMGFNLVKSYEKQETIINQKLTLKELYSIKYFKKKFERFLFPYLLLYFFQFIVTNFIYKIEPPKFLNGIYESQIYQYFGYTSLWGPGMWFIPVILGSILLFPFLYYCFSKAPTLTFISTFLIEITMQWVQHILYVDTWWYTIFFFYTNILFLLSAVGMGMWIALDSKISSKHNIIIWILGIISFGYLVGVNFIDDFRSVFHLEWISGDYNFFTFPYSALIVLIALNVLPAQLNLKGVKSWKEKFQKAIREISSSTYHILLVQILWFSIWYHYKSSIHTGFDDNPLNYIWFYPLNLLIGFVGGYLWYRFDQYWIPKSREVPIWALLYYILTLSSSIFYVSWFFGQFVVFWKYPIPDVFYPV